VVAVEKQVMVELEDQEVVGLLVQALRQLIELELQTQVVEAVVVLRVLLEVKAQCQIQVLEQVDLV
jgi:hypothetical protein